MLGKFLRNKRGNFMIGTAVMILPLIGGLAVSVDYIEMNRHKQAVLNALDAAGVALARRVIDGATDEELKQYAKDFFNANLGPVKAAMANLTVVLPDSDEGGGMVKLKASLKYEPIFLPSFAPFAGAGGTNGSTDISFDYTSTVRLKNTSEIALVLDNSGSMAWDGAGSNESRMELLKDAAKYLVNELADQAERIKQVDKPVQFSVVPFSASVNVGPEHDEASWMDTYGISPVHHENFDWTSMTGNKRVEKGTDGSYYKKGTDWGTEEDEIVTRFSLFNDMKYYSEREQTLVSHTYVCTKKKKNGSCSQGYWNDVYEYEDTTPVSFASWQGCVEARPWPYNNNDAAPTPAHPESYFVPLFAPDEPSDVKTSDTNSDMDTWSVKNNWWNDETESSTGLTRQANAKKYFIPRPYGASTDEGKGPNYSCSTPAITPLTDVTTTAGRAAVIDAIDDMEPTSGTNVPEGIAWGWRTVSSRAPFTGGRPESEKGNDKVVIILTDGSNTYTDLNSTDPAGNKSAYAAYGYVGHNVPGESDPRLFLGTSSDVGRSDFSGGNYTDALNEHMAEVCNNMKVQDDMIVFTVALDLDATDDANQITGLKQCSSESKFRKNPDGSMKKLFWNTTGDDLLEVFKAIADELSNLRIVG